MRNRRRSERGWRQRSWPRPGAVVVTAAFAVIIASCTGNASPVASLHNRGGANSAASSSGHLVLDYLRSQVTGWGAPYSRTIGGHAAVRDFTQAGSAYRLSLLSFGQAGSAPDPIYEKTPADSVVKFRRTLAREWSKYYAFRYRSGLPAGSHFVVESYSVKHRDDSGVVANGADLYLVYRPGRGQLALNSDLQFIQVVWSRGLSIVDGTAANPFYGLGSGLTSIYGQRSMNFYDNPHVSEGASGRLRPTAFRAELVLAQDTGTKNAAGKDIINIYGGVKWGWQVRSHGHP